MSATYTVTWFECPSEPLPKWKPYRPTGAGLFSADPVRVDGCAWHAGEVTSPHNDVPGYRTIQMTAPWAPVAELAHLKVGAAAAGANHTPVARLVPGRPTFPRTTAFWWEYQRVSVPRQVLVGYRDSQAEHPANKQVDDLEQHQANQPTPRQACWRQPSSATQSNFRRHCTRTSPSRSGTTNATLPLPPRPTSTAPRFIENLF